jgi:hypothetical protein
MSAAPSGARSAVDRERSYARDEWLEQVPAFGGLNQFAPAELEELLAGLGAAIDVIGGSFAMGCAPLAPAESSL